MYTIYETKNLITNKIYIGYHKTEKLNDNYLGSGVLIKKAIKKYGKEKFEKKIMYVFPTIEEAFIKEAEIVTEDFVARRDTYNVKIGGEGGWDYINKLNDDDPIKIQRKQKISEVIQKMYDEGSLVSKGWINPKGRKFSKKTKKLISLNNGMNLLEEEISKRLIDLNDIEKKRGYISKLAKKWNISHTSVKRFIDKQILKV